MLIILTGCSQSGKSTIADMLLKDKRFIKLRTATTRKRRENENEDSYYFLKKPDFDDKSKFFEYEKVHDNFYGVYKTELDEKLSSGKIVIWVLDPKGAKKLYTSLRKHLPENAIFLFLHPGHEILAERIKKRKDKDMASRIKSMENELDCIDEGIYDYLVDTSLKPEETIKFINDILQKELK